MKTIQTSARRRLLAVLPALPLAGAWRPAGAQAWPGSGTIRVVIPSGAGGGSDLFARPMAEYFARELKTNCVVDNKPGANGILAHEAVVRQPPDGYTLLISFSAALIGNKLLLPKMSHDPLVDFAPIGRIGGGGGNVLIVHPDVPARNLKELVEWTKTMGDTLTYASWGIASGGHLVMEMVKNRTGLRAAHVPYKTVSQISPDVISGVVPIAWIDSASPMPHIRSGKVRAIAVASQKRLPQILDVATLGEQGIPSEAQASYGLFAPKGTPAPVIARLNQVLNAWLKLPETIAFFEQRQNAPAPMLTTPEEYAAVLQSDLVAWKQLIADSKVTP